MSLWYDVLSAVWSGVQALAPIVIGLYVAFVAADVAMFSILAQHLDNPQARAYYEAQVSQRWKYLDWRYWILLRFPVLPARVDGGNAVDGVAPTTSGIAPGTPVQVQGPPVRLGADDAADGVASSAPRIVPPQQFTIRRKPVGSGNGRASGRVATPGSRTEGRGRLTDIGWE